MKELEKHNAKEISRIYDVLISLTKRVDKIEKHLCEQCQKERVERDNQTTEEGE